MSSRHTHHLLPALHGEGVLSLLSGFATCPGLFYATPAADGILSRIRIPGGIISSQQCCAIADIADQHGGGYVDVTNRANLQVREISTGINAKVLKHLQDMGLGSHNSFVDHIRNIMTSPTAGIDSQELIDTRPFVQSWDNYIAAHPTLSGLSAKFSVCFDGGGIIRVCDRLNDILFAAVLVNADVYFRLYLSLGAKGQPPSDTGILLTPEQCLPILAALTEVYLAHTNTRNKPRLRLLELLNTLGCDNYLQEVQQHLPFSLLSSETGKNLTPRTPSLQGKGDEFSHLLVGEGLGERSDKKYQHIGIHPQRQQGLFYIGVVLPLGRLESRQMKGLADLAAKYGSGTLRLTPWQNLLLTDIPQQWVGDVESEIAFLGLDSSAINIKSALVACSGNRGCVSSATDTKSHALALAEYLETRVTLDCPVNIHFTGCEKSCAQHSKSDITLLGVNIETDSGSVEGYHVYVGDSKQKFRREIYQYVNFTELPALIERMLDVYKIQRLNLNESFREFSDRTSIAKLQQLFNIIPKSFVNNKIPNFLEKSAI
ncbi:MAG: precorrin-3B synthase [Nostoc sp.]|uniref:precorrin-3B synthase n=1 Tax=Nostoc sp. TaxID=1180 RepID=UPI002FF4D843